MARKALLILNADRPGLRATSAPAPAGANDIDATDLVAVYSLRSLNGYAGPVVRIRRTDNIESDFTAAEITNGALLGFTGTGNGGVVTWFDQSGNLRHQQQSVTEKQPRLVSSGALIMQEGKPAIRFTGTSRMAYLDNGALNAFRQGPFSSFAVAKLDVRFANWQAIWMTSDNVAGQDGNGTIGQQFLNNRTGQFGSHETNLNDRQPAFVTVVNELDRHLFTVTRSGGDGTSNGALVTQTARSATDFQTNSGTQFFSSRTGSKLNIGKQWDLDGDDPVSHWRGTMQEIILYTADKTPQQAAIETNIRGYYAI